MGLQMGVKSGKSAEKEKSTAFRGGILRRRPIRLGYIRLVDCAPLVVAEEFGIFRDFDLDVQLSREVGWASVRDKIVYGELDASQALGPMVFAMSLGLGSLQCECVSGLVLNLHGNAITLSNELAERGVTDAKTLRGEVFRARGEKTYTFAVVYPYSSHNYLLRQWLQSGGINPDEEVDVVVLPPSQMVRNLAAGTIDGYCVGEPWNSLAVHEGVGWTVQTGCKLAPGHPEKVLMVRRDFADYRAEVHLQLIAALMEACRFCQDPKNRKDIVEMLSQKTYLNCSARLIESSFSGRYQFSKNEVSDIKDFNVFSQKDSNKPTRQQALWILDGMEEAGQLEGYRLTSSKLATRIFRPDIYQAACDLAARIIGVPEMP